MEWLILILQCATLFVMTTIASMLEDKQQQHTTSKADTAAVTHREWVVHVVRDTDAACTPCVVVTRAGQLVEMDSDVHAALVSASDAHDTESLLAGDALHDVDCAGGPIVQMRFSRTVHHGTRREEMQQVMDQHKCDLVPVHDDAPPPSVVLNDAHAVLGILLARQQRIPSSPTACDNQRPTSPRRTPRRRTIRGEASGCATTPTTPSTSISTTCTSAPES